MTWWSNESLLHLWLDNTPITILFHTSLSTTAAFFLQISYYTLMVLETWKDTVSCTTVLQAGVKMHFCRIHVLFSKIKDLLFLFVLIIILFVFFFVLLLLVLLPLSFFQYSTNTSSLIISSGVNSMKFVQVCTWGNNDPNPNLKLPTHLMSLLQSYQIKKMECSTSLITTTTTQTKH